MSVKVHKYTPDALRKLLAEEKLLVLDVRPDKYEGLKGFLEGTVRCPLLFLQERHTAIDKDKKIVVVDAFMKQSPIAAKFLTREGYHVAGVLRGGAINWQKQGFPVVDQELISHLQK